MIDVCGNDRTAARDLGPHKLWCYFIRDLGTKTFAGMLLSEIVAGDCGIRNSEFGIFGSRTGFFIPHSAFRICSLIAMNSISGVMMPWRAYQSCVTQRPARA